MMDELLKAIEELKRAYKASGSLSVRISIVGDKYFECQVLNSDGSLAEIPHKQTNGEWLRSLNDEELAKTTLINCDNFTGENGRCDRLFYACEECRLAWLRAEHKE